MNSNQGFNSTPQNTSQPNQQFGLPTMFSNNFVAQQVPVQPINSNHVIQLLNQQLQEALTQQSNSAQIIQYLLNQNETLQQELNQYKQQQQFQLLSFEPKRTGATITEAVKTIIEDIGLDLLYSVFNSNNILEEVKQMFEQGKNGITQEEVEKYNNAFQTWERISDNQTRIVLLLDCLKSLSPKSRCCALDLLKNRKIQIDAVLKELKLDLESIKTALATIPEMEQKQKAAKKLLYELHKEELSLTTKQAVATPSHKFLFENLFEIGNTEFCKKLNGLNKLPKRIAINILVQYYLFDCYDLDSQSFFIPKEQRNKISFENQVAGREPSSWTNPIPSDPFTLNPSALPINVCTAAELKLNLNNNLPQFATYTLVPTRLFIGNNEGTLHRSKTKRLSATEVIMPCIIPSSLISGEFDTKLQYAPVNNEFIINIIKPNSFTYYKANSNDSFESGDMNLKDGAGPDDSEFNDRGEDEDMNSNDYGTGRIDENDSTHSVENEFLSFISKDPLGQSPLFILASESNIAKLVQLPSSMLYYWFKKDKFQRTALMALCACCSMSSIKTIISMLAEKFDIQELKAYLLERNVYDESAFNFLRFNRQITFQDFYALLKDDFMVWLADGSSLPCNSNILRIESTNSELTTEGIDTTSQISLTNSADLSVHENRNTIQKSALETPQSVSTLTANNSNTEVKSEDQIIDHLIQRRRADNSELYQSSYYEKDKEEWDSDNYHRCYFCWMHKDNHLVDCEQKGYDALMKWIKTGNNLASLASNSNLSTWSTIYSLVKTWFLNTCKVNHGKEEHVTAEFRISSIRPIKNYSIHRQYAVKNSCKEFLLFYSRDGLNEVDCSTVSYGDLFHKNNNKEVAFGNGVYTSMYSNVCPLYGKPHDLEKKEYTCLLCIGSLSHPTSMSERYSVLGHQAVIESMIGRDVQFPEFVIKENYALNPLFQIHYTIDVKKDPKKTYFLNRYELVKKIAQAGQGAVYQCIDVLTGKHVAVKIYEVKNEERETMHLENVRKLFENTSWKRRYLTPYLHVDRIQGTENNTYVVMPLYYQTLRGFINTVRLTYSPITTEQIICVFKQIINGVDLIHEENLIHKDLKSDNIMLDHTGTVKILDYNSLPHNEVNFESVLAPLYTAPEPGFTKKTDIYSLGVILFELIALQPVRDVFTVLGMRNLMVTEAEELKVHEKLMERMNYSNVSSYLKRLVLTIVMRDAKSRPSVADIKEVLCFIDDGECGILNIPLKPIRSRK